MRNYRRYYNSRGWRKGPELEEKDHIARESEWVWEILGKSLSSGEKPKLLGLTVVYSGTLVCQT